MAVRLWLVALAGIPLVFFSLPMIPTELRSPWLLAAGALILVVLWAGTGLVLHWIGQMEIQRCIREAGAWERVGLVNKSHQLYLKAFSTYDSFLLTPWRSAGAAASLTSAAARFSLYCSRRSPELDRASAAYLKRSGGQDPDLAAMWLKRMCATREASRDDHSVMTRLAEQYGDHPEILPLLASAFVRFRRVDFSARKTYAAVEQMGSGPVSLYQAIHHLVAQDTDPDDVHVLEPPVLAFQETDPLLPRIWQGMSRAGIQVLDLLRTGGDLLAGLFSRGMSGLRQGGAAGVALLKKKELRRRAALWAVTALAGSACLVLIINTVAFLHRSGLQEKAVPGVLKEVPQRFTIQVAAYLKKTHADTYVAQLKEKGLDAYLSQADGGGRTWFLVRVSAFPDRASARQFGERLKQDRAIDDFFVDNLDNGS